MNAPTSKEAISDTVSTYVLSEFLPGEDRATLTVSTPLVSGRILDSLALLKLVAFLEERYGIQIEAHEADADHLDTIAQIVDLVQAKL